MSANIMKSADSTLGIAQQESRQSGYLDGFYVTGIFQVM